MFTKKDLQVACKDFWTRYENVRRVDIYRSAFERLQWTTELYCWGSREAMSSIGDAFRANLQRLGLWLSAWHPLEVPFMHERLFARCLADHALFYKHVVSTPRVWQQWAFVFLTPSRQYMPPEILRQQCMDNGYYDLIDWDRVQEFRRLAIYAYLFNLSLRVRALTFSTKLF